jgi:hypothetical protein
MRLAENYYVSIDVLDRLGRDENPYVQNRAELTVSRIMAESINPPRVYA